MLNVEIQFSPSFAMATVKLNQGEAIQAEAGAMTGMAGGMEISTKAQGGILGGLKRSVLGGETFFINTFTAASGPGEIIVAPPLPGDIIHMPLDGSAAMMVQSGSWLAGEAAVAIDTKWGGAKTFFAGEGLFLLKCTGQ